MEHLLQPKKVRKDFWINILNPDVPTSIGYLRLGELMHFIKITNILTTFYECIIKARNEINRPHHIPILKDYPLIVIEDTKRPSHAEKTFNYKNGIKLKPKDFS